MTRARALVAVAVIVGAAQVAAWWSLAAMAVGLLVVAAGEDSGR